MAAKSRRRALAPRCRRWHRFRVEFRVMSIKRLHTAIYGNVALLRGPCPCCGSESILQDGVSLCCGVSLKYWDDYDETALANAQVAVKRMTSPRFKRNRPPKHVQLSILKAQENRCVYCDQEFGNYVWKSGRLCRLRVDWDHFVPYTYSANNRAENFVAACHVCNGLKSDKHFDSIEQAKEYIRARREEKGITVA